MYRDLDIVYFTLFPWDHPYSSVSLSFAKEFAKNNRVFYINHPYSIRDFFENFNDKMVKERRSDLLKHKMRYETIPDLSENIIAVHPPLTLPINWLPPGRLYDKLADFNNQIILKTIKQVIDDHQLKDFIYINCFNPYFAGYLPKSYGQILNIYQCIDDMEEEPYTARHGARLEREIAKQADITTGTASKLCEMMSEYSRSVHLIHNAADTGNFERAVHEKFERPEEIKDLQGKIIGFTGNLDHCRIDYPLLKKVALGYPDKTLLLVGPINNTEYKEIGLDQLPNVVFTGSKDITELPQYLQFMDCVLLPYALNKLTQSIYPLKINEYLAAGKPVISTKFSKDILQFENTIYLSDSDEHYIDLINKAIAENSEEKTRERIAVARTNTWTDRVEQFWKMVESHMMKKEKLKTKIL